MAGRKVQGREEAELLLARARDEGLSLTAVARAHGVDGRSLVAWRSNHRWVQTGGVPPGVRLVELVAPPVARAARHRVEVGSFTVEVGEDFGEATLSRLLRLAAQC
jgi:transposase-like protein